MGKKYQDGIHGSVFYGTRELLLAINPRKKIKVLNELLNLLKYDTIEIYINNTKKKSIRDKLGINNKQRYNALIHDLVDDKILTIVSKEKYIINPELLWYGSHKNKEKAIGKYQAFKHLIEKRPKRIR